MLLGNSKPVAFYSTGRRRNRFHVPGWLVLLLTGMGLGVVAVLYIQERYLPPRISVEAGERLRDAIAKSEVAQTVQASQLSETSRQLDASQGERKKLADELADSRAAVDRLQGDLKAIVASLPPDPRDGAVQVRAGRFVAAGASLNYSVVLTHGRASEAPVPVSMQYVVSGETAQGTSKVFTTPAQAASVGSSSVQRGTIALPDGLRPRQVAIHILDRGGSRSLGMRVLEVE